MRKRGMPSYERFDDDILEAFFQDLNLQSASLAALFPYNVIIDLFQASLVSISSALLVIILNGRAIPFGGLSLFRGAAALDAWAPQV